MKAKLTLKHKAMAYILNYEFGYSMNKIAELMSVSQSTVSNSIQKFIFEMRINDLQSELNEAREQLDELGYCEPVINIPPKKLEVLAEPHKVEMAVKEMYKNKK